MDSGEIILSDEELREQEMEAEARDDREAERAEKDRIKLMGTAQENANNGKANNQDQVPLDQ